MISTDSGCLRRLCCRGIGFSHGWRRLLSSVRRELISTGGNWITWSYARHNAFRVDRFRGRGGHGIAAFEIPPCPCRNASPHCDCQDVGVVQSRSTHWVTDNLNKAIATVPGNFQSELGCSGDWDPSCLRSWLQDPDGNGIYGFFTTERKMMNIKK